MKLSLKFLIINLLFLPVYLLGQEWNFVKEINLHSSPVVFSVDIQGNLYLGFQDGNLTKYDFDGVMLENFSLPNTSEITLIDVQNSLKPFLFYFDNQQITILDRFSSVPKTYSLENFGISLVTMTCPAVDGDFWMLQNNPRRLLKFNPLKLSFTLEIGIPSGDLIKQMQVYQNLLLVSDMNELKIFDQFGALIHSFQLTHFTNFQVVNKLLYAYTSEWIYLINPFRGIIESKISSPSIDSRITLKSRDRFIVLNHKSIAFYEQ